VNFVQFVLAVPLSATGSGDRDHGDSLADLERFDPLSRNIIMFTSNRFLLPFYFTVTNASLRNVSVTMATHGNGNSEER
jgi:hypothetical protein